MRPLETLRATTEDLPPAIRDEILALGASAVPELVSILRDEALGSDEAPGEGWPPIHAVDLLVDLKAVEAIEPMLDVLVATASDDMIHDRIILRLPKLGAPVLEPALARLAHAADEEVFRSLLGIIASLGVKDERVFPLLCDEFDADPPYGAMLFADYGDRRAVPLLRDALDDFEPDPSRPLHHVDFREMLEAYEGLGGAVDEELRARSAALFEAWLQRTAPRAGVRSSKIGRNDPCPCGSGKKHKKCCLGATAER